MALSVTSAPPRHRAQNTARHAAEHEFTQARVAVAAHDYEIDVGIGCVQRVGDVEAAVVDALDFHFKSVTREVLAHIGAFDLILLAAFVGDDDYLAALASSGIAAAIARACGSAPSQHTMTRSSLSGAFWM